MRISTERILTTHTGSLPHPPELTELYLARSRGETFDKDRMQSLGKEAIFSTVGQQMTSGVDIGNDGEQDREGFFLYVQHRMSGFGGKWDRRVPQDVERYSQYKARRAAEMSGKAAMSNFQPPKGVGEVRYLDPTSVQAECDVFTAALQAAEGEFVEPFLTAPSPGIVCSAMKNEHYETLDAYLAAVADALRVEYEAIVSNGYLLQLDCPDLALERHVTYQDRPVSEFIDFVERVIEALNQAISSIPRDRVRLHVCWGNYEAPHDSDVPLADILPVLQRANVGALVLPFANPRHAHEYKVFERMPLADDQVLVAGVIDTLTNFVEHPEVVADRLERIAAVVGGPQRVIACTDCGFDTSAGMGRVSADVVWAKLSAMAEGARLASERLF